MTNRLETPQPEGQNYIFIKKFQNGKYTFKATYPGVYNARPIPHIHYKVSIIKVTILKTPQIVFSSLSPTSPG